MKVLVACEYSGVVRDAFLKLGHDAWSCDTLPSDTEPMGIGRHLQGDVRWWLDNPRWNWDLMIAHPPCTYLANSGVCHLHTDERRWAKLDEGAAFFKELLDAPIDKICAENPIMHKYARERIGGTKYAQIIQPWMFGHPEKKATCLWLKNLPKLEETNNVKAYMETLPKNQQQRLHYLPPSKDRWKLRSTTFQGIADAMADQWGHL